MGETGDHRWRVVTNDGTPIWTGMYRRANAETEAGRLNAEGLADYAPYRVEPDSDTTAQPAADR